MATSALRATVEPDGDQVDVAPPPTIVGKVASPPRRESTSDEFYFWVKPETLVEKTQIVRTDCVLGGVPLQFFGLVREVYRQSRQASMFEEQDRYDGDVAYTPPYEAPGVTFAAVTILRTVPPVLAPPLEGSDVVLGGEPEARMAYGADEIEHPLAVGLVKNGGSRLAGPGRIDLDYLLGANGGHLNVNGVAGRGTKSSFLLHVNYLLIREAQRQKDERQSDSHRLRVVPIILNVKNFDLFHIDRPSQRFDPSSNLEDWRRLGIFKPGPFEGATFFASQMRRSNNPVATGRPRADVQPYSWSLADVIERGLFSYLFAEEDVRDANFGALVLDIESWLTFEDRGRDGQRQRRLSDAPNRPRHFDGLMEWIHNQPGGAAGDVPNHYKATWQKLYRRLRGLLLAGDGVLRRDEETGHPLDVVARDTQPPTVVDLSALAALPSLQRFVAATIFQQLVEDRTGSNVQKGLVYLVTLDELNRFAPRGAHDPITRLIETVAAEMRSQGVILLGAQQQASLVSTRVIENAGIKALGKSGSMELGQDVWRFLSDSAKRKAGALLPEEKLLVQDSFREPMLVKVPKPPWAMRGEEATDHPTAGTTAPAAGKFDELGTPS